MAIDFNAAEEQREFTAGAIPPNSMVKVRLTIRQPDVAGSDPMLKLSKKGDCEMLDCEFEVVAGQFATRKIWNNFIIGGTSEGHRKAGQISMRVMRAIVEASRGISPKDQSPAACQGRVVNQWRDLQGVEFGIVVGVEAPKPGDRYINNSIKRIIIADDEQYQHIMAGGEIITDAPIPEVPQAAQTAAPTWAAPKAQPAAPATASQGALQAPQTVAPQKTWQAPQATAQQATGAMPPPSGVGGAPGWAAPQSADVPF